MRLCKLFFCFFLWLFSLSSLAQDSVPIKEDSVQVEKYTFRKIAKPVITDSAALARQHVSDSLAWIYIRQPDPLRKNMFIVERLKEIQNRAYIFFDKPQANNSKSFRQAGKAQPVRDVRVLIIITGLLVYSAFIGRFLHKEILEIVQSIYIKRIFIQISKEDSLFNSLSFLLLFSLFGFTFGLFLYQLTGYHNARYEIGGYQLFFTLSIVVFLLFAFKILVLRTLGFVFAIQKLVQEYVSILYVSYFNLAFIFLMVVLLFSMLSARYIPLLLLAATSLIGLIFVFQYLRSSLNVIASFRFRKVYLIIYLCALEICPILILIKALKF
ncbi:MAG: DUF4271 domain-containing protein [Sphingobacteriaceae bacterium]